MKNICLYFQVHQPFRIRRYRFFDIGDSEYYYDDYANESLMKKIAAKCYLPANHLMFELIEKYGNRFKIAYSISGTALDQFELYAPEVLESFRKLADTGMVEFLAETHSHSLVSLADPDEFRSQVTRHSERIEALFGVKPKVFRNTELVYSDEIGSLVADMGYEAMLSEGARHMLGWKSPNYLYNNAVNPKLKVLLRNFMLSDDIAFRFSDRHWDQWPLTADKYVMWLKNKNRKEDIVNIFIDYETFGEHHSAESGIFDFFRALPPAVLKHKEFKFLTPSEAVSSLQPVDAIHVPYPASWADEEKDLSAWLGNDMQNEAFSKLNGLRGLVRKTNDHIILTDWHYLQVSDHLYYMSTKVFSDRDVHKHYNPYESPYDAFINYMNVLSDFTRRLNKLVGSEEAKTVQMERMLKEKQEQIASLQQMINEMREAKQPIVAPVGITEKQRGETSTPADGTIATGAAAITTSVSAVTAEINKNKLRAPEEAETGGSKPQGRKSSSSVSGQH
jgi:alpha-amylase